MLQVDPIQSYLNLKIGLHPVLKAGSSAIMLKNLIPYLIYVLKILNLKRKVTIKVFQN